MKKTMLLAVYTVVLFSSFTTPKEPLPVLHKKTLSAPAEVPFSAKGSYTWEDVTGYVCNGDVLYFPTITVTYDFHGVYNGRAYMVQGVDRLYGTGSSTTTTEKFVADFTTKYTEKYSAIKGAVVIKQKSNNSFTGDQGTVDSYTLSFHLTFDANGVLDSEKSSIEIVCQ
jgi:hypothetical protein